MFKKASKQVLAEMRRDTPSDVLEGDVSSFTFAKDYLLKGDPSADVSELDYLIKIRQDVLDSRK